MTDGHPLMALARGTATSRPKLPSNTFFDNVKKLKQIDRTWAPLVQSRRYFWGSLSGLPRTNAVDWGEGVGQAVVSARVSSNREIQPQNGVRL